MQRTITVDHPEAHEPTSDQLDKAVKAELKAEGLKAADGYTLRFRSGTSGQSSTYVVTFEGEEVAKPKRAAKKAEPKTEAIPAAVELQPVVTMGDVAVEDLATGEEKK